MESLVHSTRPRIFNSNLNCSKYISQWSLFWFRIDTSVKLVDTHPQKGNIYISAPPVQLISTQLLGVRVYSAQVCYLIAVCGSWRSWRMRICFPLLILRISDGESERRHCGPTWRRLDIVILCWFSWTVDPYQRGLRPMTTNITLHIKVRWAVG